MLHILTFSLENPARDYHEFGEALRSLGDARLQIFKNAWLLHTQTEGATEIQHILQPTIEANDRLFVAEITHQQRNGWMNRNVWAWAAEHDN